ncbi:vesicular glutamate transporter 1 [Diachasmimorpha longicaudata]|uniref:vesicular glutamate transporter 1 n=1 Tax=Diachasmimorpha longicaudata TaxID=58733 RepID=UPI0030B8B120
MSGFAAAGLGALGTIKARVEGTLAGYRATRRPSAGYDEFELPRNRGSKDNMGFEDEKGYDGRASFDSLPEPERPPLRHIDMYIKPECPCLSTRFTVAVLACVGFIISFGMRANMGMAKLAIANETDSNGTRIHNWGVGTESAMDSSFFLGYLITQVPGGFLASLYPANKVFGLAIAISSFLNLLVPGAINTDPYLDMFVQVLKGLVEGVTYPACHGIWKNWAPPLERSRLATLAFCGSYAAVVIGMPLSGCLNSWFNWSVSFYVYGIAGLIWYTAWLWLVFERPSKHPSITARELRYIEDSLGQAHSQAPQPTFNTTPWKKFFTSMPVYAIIVANFCRSWNFYLLVLYQARYMSESFGLSTVETGMVGSIPHLLMTCIVPLGGMLADYLRRTGKLTTTQVRKLFNCGGFGTEAFFFLIVAYATVHKNPTGATIALTFGVAGSGFAISGFNVNHLDIAPRYASILMGMSNGIGTIAGLLVPVFVDHMTKNHSADEWTVVFIIAACVHGCGVTFYAIFCSGELQSWADPSLEEQKSWNPLDDLGQVKPPVPPPPKIMQSEFIRQPSGDINAGWNDDVPHQGTTYDQQEKIGTQPVINYGSTETNASNPFRSTNPFASGISETLVQPPARDDYTHDIVQHTQWE